MAATWQELQEQAPPGCSICGWATADERQGMLEMAQRMRSGQVFLEIGIYGGASLCLFALASPPGVEAIGIEDFSNTTHQEKNNESLESLVRRNIAASGCADKIRLVKGRSQDIGPSWDTWVDVLRVDGGHTYWAVKSDLDNFMPWVKPHGLVIMDNYLDLPDVKQAFDAWRKTQSHRAWKVVKRYRNRAMGTSLILQRT